jgi:hypothetical protein
MARTLRPANCRRGCRPLAAWSGHTIKKLSPTAYSFRWEVAGKDGSWNLAMEGKSTKVE